MDAQNAAEPAFKKPAASPKRPGSDSDHTRPSTVTKSSSTAKPELSLKDSRPSASGPRPGDEDGAAEGNSDAETIVLPGKDGHSPSKVRKIIKHEKSDAEDAAPSSLLSRKPSHLKQEREGDKGERGDRPEKPDRTLSVTGTGANENTASILGKKKKHLDKPKIKDGSSGLSSAPGSPPQPQRRRRPSNAHSKSDSETAPVDSTNAAAKDKAKSLDKVVPHKRKAPRPDSDDEAETRKIRRQRTSGSGLDASRKHHLPPPKPHHETNFSSRTRSISPSRAHRRSISTQLPGNSSNGLGQKKKRIPAPLSTDYHSDESSASGSPHPRSSKLRGLATPATAESTVSPAKMAPHKKHLDAHGQTFLARACAKGEYDIAKQRLQERPEDINVADYAGNTPLQIAALNGYDDIVRLLVDAGCNLDCVNNDKDTPLLDAVENGHLDVVKILLDAGVNPRKANAYGQEPIDRVNDELDNADEIRAALQEAKQKMGERRRTSEEHHPDLADTRSSHGPDSPRRSPGAPGSIHAGGGRRAGTVRATKTSNHLLYMPMDDKTLRAAAARGDEETVTRILQVRENFDDPESMVAAARGGHDIVMQLLLALGRANPDPPPIPSSNSEYSTPMLAAIGQENIKVVRLLLDQNDFDPTRRVKGETYYEIAKRRRGPNWMEEEHMLKDAYDEYKKTHKESSKNRSPSRREQDREPRRKGETKDEAAKVHKRKAVSPTREPKKLTATKQPTSPKEKRRPASLATQHDEQTSPKRGPGRPKKEDRVPTIATSDREPSPAARPVAKVRRAESDLAAVSSEGETVKPRRKLVSGRELKGERERQQQRRPSLTSNASTMKEPSSPREEPDRVQKTEKYHDRTKALKRDESRERLSVSGESTGKRYRSSATPPHLGPADKDGNEVPVKRRRLDAEAKEKRPKSSQSDDRLPKAAAPRDLPSNSATGPRPPSKAREDDDRKLTPKPKKADTLLHHGRRESGKSVSSEGSIHVKSEDPDVNMPDAGPLVNEASAPRSSLQKEKEEDEKRKNAELEARARETKRKEEEKRRREEEEKEKERLRREEEAKRIAEAEARKREEEQRRKEEEERERTRKEEEERRRREEEERKQREEEERRRLEEEEKMKREEAERRRRVEEERRQKEEEERKKREEDERLRREQLEREAAEEARRKREEEERKEQERKERALREEMERRRAAREAERAAKEADQRRIRLEQERARLAKLPPVLRWLDSAVNPKLPEVAEKFSTMQGVRYDCINPEANGTRDGREQWLLNTQVALLLGEKDLELSRCTSEPRRVTRCRTTANESIQIPPGLESPSQPSQSALFGGWSQTDMR
jgi:ankyrin repeat protein